MEYIAGKGTTFVIKGAPVGDEEFFRMVLKIWIGEVPAEFQLKNALLDTGSSNSGN